MQQPDHQLLLAAPDLPLQCTGRHAGLAAGLLPAEVLLDFLAEVEQLVKLLPVLELGNLVAKDRLQLLPCVEGPTTKKGGQRLEGKHGSYGLTTVGQRPQRRTRPLPPNPLR